MDATYGSYVAAEDHTVNRTGNRDNDNNKSNHIKNKHNNDDDNNSPDHRSYGVLDNRHLAS